MRRALTLILALLFALVGGLAAATPASAGKADVTFTLDAPGFSQAGAVAKLWSGGTGVAVVLGDCTPGTTGCISAVMGDYAPCGFSGAAGCAYGSHASGGYVIMSPLIYSWSNDSVVEFNALGHEVGHVIVGTSWHNPDTRSIMHAKLSPHDRKKTLLRDDKQLSHSRY